MQWERQDIGSNKRWSDSIPVNSGKKTVLFLLFYFLAIKTCYCTMLSSKKTLSYSKSFVKHFNCSLILTGCSLCWDLFFYNWEALRHPGQLERLDKRKLTALPNPLLNLPFPPHPQHITEDFISEMYLMKFQINILLKWQPAEATVFKATEYWRIKNLPTQGSQPTSEGDLFQCLPIMESQNVFKFPSLTPMPEMLWTFKIMK